LIVFAAFLLLISLANYNVNAKTNNLGSAIWVERYYQAEMNAKEAVIEAARQGAVEGAEAYFTSAAQCTNPPYTYPNIQCLGKDINSKAIEAIEEIDGKTFDGLLVSVQLTGIYEDDACQTSCDPAMAGNLIINPVYSGSPSDLSSIGKIHMEGQQILIIVSNPSATGWTPVSFSMPEIYEEMG
jgi:hypothetical protein